MKEKIKSFFINIWEFLKRMTLPDFILFGVIIAMFIIPNTKFEKNDIDMQENRALAKFPHLIEDGKYNTKYGKQFEAFYNDRFRKRRKCIEAFRNTKSFINNKKENIAAFEGADHWLFLKADYSMENFQNKLQFSDEELANINKSINRLHNWAKKHNIKVIMIIPADKSRIYGEYYPSYIQKTAPKSRVENLITYIDKNSKYKILSTQKIILEEKEKTNDLLYFKTDTHWTDKGGYFGYKLLADEIKKLYPKTDVIKADQLVWDYKTISEITSHDGDLFRMLGLKNLKDYHEKYPALKEVKNPPKKQNLKIYIVGDSYAGQLNAWFMRGGFDVKWSHYNLTPQLAETFSMKRYEKDILDNKTDVLVVEFLERYAYNFNKLYKD